MISKDSFKFRVEVAIRPPQKGFKNLNQFMVWYNKANSIDASEPFDDVCELGDSAFKEIAGLIADEYLLCKASTLKNFVFGNYGYELGSICEHDKIFHAIKNMIMDCFNETFDYDFFEHNKDKLEVDKFYEYIFDVSFEMGNDSFKRTSLDVTLRQMES